jgi:transcriptional regulator with XRE-family HTH domain
MTDFQREREALGAWLHRLRRDSGLNGKELAARLGWAASKVSRIEHGRQTPTEQDVAAWAAAVGAPSAADELTARLSTLDSHYVSWRRSLHAGHAPRQRVAAELDGQTRQLRAFEPGMIPGLLQTAEYARTVFTSLVELNGTPQDVAAAVRARMERQQVLYEPGKDFHFLVTMAALRSRLCRTDAHRGQLDRLLAVGSLANVRLGVVPDAALLPLAPLHPFWIFDERLVQAEVWTAELNITEAREVEVYTRVFDSYARAAFYGAEARRLIGQVLQELAGYEPRCGPPTGSVTGASGGAASAPPAGGDVGAPLLPPQLMRGQQGRRGADSQ